MKRKIGGPLTPRQREVIRLIVQGMKMKDIAHQLDITPRTVAFHKYTVMEQYSLNNNFELIQFAIRCGIVTVAAEGGTT